MKTIHPARLSSTEHGFFIFCECAIKDGVTPRTRIVWVESNQIVRCEHCGRSYLWKNELIMYDPDEEVFG